MSAINDSPDSPGSPEERAKELHRRYNAVLLSFTRRYLLAGGCRNPGECALDINQSTWDIIVRKFDQFHFFVPWAKKIIEHQVVAHVSDPNGCKSQNESLDTLTESNALPAALIIPAQKSVEAVLLFREILAHAAKLDPILPRIIELKCEGFDFKAIGKEVGESAGNARTILSRGLLKLRKKLGNNVLNADQMTNQKSGPERRRKTEDP